MIHLVLKSVFVMMAALFIPACGFESRSTAVSEAGSPYPTTLPNTAPSSIAEDNFKKDWSERLEASKAELENNRKKWNGRAIRSYSFVASKHAGGTTNNWNGGPVIIEVIDGHTEQIKAGKEPVLVQSSIEEDFADFNTVPKLFDHVLKRLENGELVEARFDADLGYPKFVQFTLHYSHGHNSQVISITEFRPRVDEHPL